MDAEEILSEKIGQGLIRMGEMTAEQVEAVLEAQGKGDSRLFGEIAVDMEFIDLMSVIRYMEQQ
jgi:hypothetical protein